MTQSADPPATATDGLSASLTDQAAGPSDLSDQTGPTLNPSRTTAGPTTPSPRTLPRAGVRDTLRVVTGVVGPLLARGVIIRRPPLVRHAERVDADTKAVRLLQDLRRRYGRGPLRLRIPGRRMVVLLSPEHVHCVLDQTPYPFTPASWEKRRALSHFQPHGVLISSGEDRADRRRFNAEVLDEHNAVHRGAEHMVGGLNTEVDALLADVVRDGELTWERYARTWMRIVRRVVLGDGAVDDEQLTDDLSLLRATANWAFLHPRRRGLRARFFERLRVHLDRAEPGSLAGQMATTATTARTEPEHQVPQWLFAFDAGTWASYRALALVAAHPWALTEARTEAAGRDLRRPQDLPFLRAAVRESLRLWPTTPAVLRESVARTHWEDGPMPEKTSIFTYAPLFHRDDENLPEAHRFAPELWAEERTAADWPLIPFSAGPAVCPGRNLVLHVMSSVLARLVSELDLTLEGDRLVPGEPLPGTLDPFSLRFRATPRPGVRDLAPPA